MSEFTMVVYGPNRQVLATAAVPNMWVVLDVLQVGLEGLEDADTRAMVGVSDAEFDGAWAALQTLSESLKQAAT
jgi:hypothetical protein